MDIANRTWVFQDARVIDPARGIDAVMDVFVHDGKIVSSLPGRTTADQRISGRGRVLVPGLIDLHVHFREPGNEKAETVASGSRAAARGGFTRVVTMPNTKPATDNPGLIAATKARGDAAGLVHVMPAGCITADRMGTKVADLEAMARAGAAAFTDDGTTVTDEAVMLEAMRGAARLGLTIMDHALDPTLAGSGVMRQGVYADRLGFPGMPPAAEAAIVERDIRLAAATGCATHIQHIFAAKSVELIRKAQGHGFRVSGEATPHHLALCDADIPGNDANFKMNPPLASSEDRALIRAAVADGTLEAFATDHAPHTQEDKEKGFMLAPFGVVGLETAVGVTHTIMVRTGCMALFEWVKRWTTGPARILGIPPPTLAPGEPADLVLLDLTSKWIVEPKTLKSLSRNTPFDKWELVGQSLMTMKGGSPTWILK